MQNCSGLYTVLRISMPPLFLLLTACNDGSDTVAAAPAPPTPPAPTTTLSASVSSLALAVNGVPRTITITNTGADIATDVAYAPSPALPAGTTISPADCGAIVAAGSCVITVTPGATPSAAAGDINPSHVVLTLSGTNTNTLSPALSILDYGSVHQSGYVFAIDDTTSNTGGIGGKVAALSDQASAFPNGIIWSSNGNGGSAVDVELNNIPGIYETSTNPPDACEGNADGICAAQAIVDYYSPPTTNPAVNLTFYAAGLCKTVLGGYSDWYLPAICELGYDAAAAGSGCGTLAVPTLQNMQSNLVDNGNIGALAGIYWSSTEASINPLGLAFAQNFDIGGGSLQLLVNKSDLPGVRCARAMTN